MNKRIFPTTIFGAPVKGAIERVLAKENSQIETPIVNPTPIQNQDEFIYIPSINLYVAKQRTLLGKNWFECHQELQSNQERMLTIPEFIEFLKYTKINYLNIYNEITEQIDPWRAEWLDADFKKGKNGLYLNSKHVLDSNGNLIPQFLELLDKDTLMKDKTPGISLDDYLNLNHTSQGLPNKKVQSGNLYYRYPRDDNNSVARFDADSVRVILYCGRSPSIRYPAFGVRAVRHV